MIGVAAAFWKLAASGNVKPSQLAEFKELIDTYNKTLYVQETANLYGVSEQSLYRALAQRARPRALRRSDRGTPRILPQDKMEYYCELIAALKVRTSNKKGRHLSTGEAIRLVEEFVVETPEGLIKAQKSMFKITTVNRYLEHPSAIRLGGQKPPDPLERTRTCELPAEPGLTLTGSF